MKLKKGKLYQVRNQDTGRWNKVKYVTYDWLYGQIFVSSKNKYIFVDELRVNSEVKK